MAVTGSEQISGLVEAVNEKGVKINGAWTNYSKFADGLVAPARGASVTLTLDRSGFIRSVASADGSAVVPTPQGAQNGTSSHKDRTITRLAVLKAAAEFGAARPNLKSGDVLAIAASWEKWIYREQEVTYELTDAF